MEKQIYTPMERVLIQGAMLAQALEEKKKVAALLELDLMLLEMEEKQDMLDGIKLQEWIL